MSEANPEQQAAPAEATTTEAAPAEFDFNTILEQAPAEKRDLVKESVEGLVADVMKGVTKFDKNVLRTIKSRVAAIDAAISKQLSAIMHHPDFQQLEGTWRGLNYLVMNSETGTGLKIKVFNVSKRELHKDISKAVEFDQSQIFKKLYENEFGQPGGQPYGALVGDYAFSNHPDDMELLNGMAGVAAASFCPFITSPAPSLFGMSSYTELSKPRDLATTFDSVDYASWRSFRESEDSRFVAMAMPRVLARLPYGQNTKPIDEFDFEEADLNTRGESIAIEHDHYCWMNCAYVLGARLTDAFSKTGWCTAIRGAENGGKVEGLPAHVFTTDEGDKDLKCPTEIAITDRRSAELDKLGFMPLSHYKDTDYAVFFGGQTVQKPKKYEGKDGDAATANAAISARLPYIMATSRFAHYLKVIARDKIGSFMEADECETWLNEWINNYVLADATAKPELKAQYPLAEAMVRVTPIPGAPGSYNAEAYLRPWLQLEELTASMRLVAEIPKFGS